MTDKQFNILWKEAISDDDRDVYISDWALSSIWEGENDITEAADVCGIIWDVAHMSVAEIRTHTGLTQAEFATKFCVPLRTVQNWEYRGCPDYIRLMMARIIGLIFG